MINNFFKQYYFYLIISSIIILIFIIVRFYLLFKITLDIKERIQKAEFRETYFLTRDQYHLAANYYFNKDNKNIIINIHDFGNNHQQFALINEYFQKNNFNYFSFDLRWSDFKQKQTNIGTILTDIIDNIKLLQQLYPYHQFYLFGQGLGANIILFIISKLKNITGLILFNNISKKRLFKFNIVNMFLLFIGFCFNLRIKLPLTINYPLISNNLDVQNNVKQNLKENPLRMIQLVQINKIATKSLKKISKLKIPILILQSKNDIFANIKNIEKNINNNKLVSLINLNDYHDLLQSNNLEIYFNLINDWIKNNF